VFFVEPLRPDHALGGFTCGNGELDDWLKRSAWNATLAGSARTRVWVDDAGAVVAYFTTAPHVVQRDAMPKKISRGGPATIPCYLLAKLALAAHLHGHPDRYGSVLLADALDWLVEAARAVGGKLIVVDAIDEAAARFYEHHGFGATPIPHRLYLKVSAAAASLAKPWP
jgi:GNAT superfamily N-acetyltransferase